MTLDFDEASHTYRLDGQLIPSVTQVLAPLVDYSMVAPEVLERARQLGTAVHKTVSLDCASDLDEESLSEELWPYLAGWRAFCRDTGFMVGTSEQQLAHTRLKFAGTSDITGRLYNRHVVIDLKTMAVLGPIVGVQLAAYQALHNNNNVVDDLIMDRYGLKLTKTGSYKCIQYSDPADWTAFMALLTLHNWRLRHG